MKSSQIPTDITKVDHETGLIHVPGRGNLPLIGPTSGSAYEDLKAKEKQNRAAMLHLKRQMLSTFQCTQCKRKQPGTQVRVKWMKTEGVDMETLVCRDPKCDAPVVMIEDARDLRAIPTRQ